MVIADISIVPIGTSSPSVSRYVAKCIEVLKRRGLNYRLCPMSTVVEGELKDIVDAIVEMHETPFKEGALRVVTTIKIDDRRDKIQTMDSKIKSVKEKVGD